MTVTDARDAYSRHVEILRISCIIAVVFIHIPPTWQYGVDFSSGAMQYSYVFLNYGVLRAAVPTLSAISGYLLFRSFAASRYRSLVLKKLRTVLVPALLWAGGTVAALYVAQRAGLIAAGGFDLVNGDLFTYLDAVFGLGTGPVNLPIYFLYDLIVCILVSPLLFAAMRHAPWAGLVVLAGLWLSGFDDYLWIRGDILLGFYVGGLLALRRVDLGLSRGRALTLIAVFLLAAAAFAAYAGSLPGKTLETGVDLELNLLRLLGPPAMWAYACLVAESRFGRALTRLGAMAFFIYCIHSPLMTLLAKAWFSAPSELASAWYPVFYVGAPVAVLLLAIVAMRVLDVVFPSALAVLSGGRLGRPSVDRRARVAEPGLSRADG